MHQPTLAIDGPAPAELFGANVRAARERLGLSQRALANALAGEGLSLDPSAVTRLERAEREVRISEAVVLARVLQTTVADLVGEVRDEPERALMRARVETDEEMNRARQALIEALRGFEYVQLLLRENPALLPRLADHMDPAPRGVEDYLPWVRKRVQRVVRDNAVAVGQTRADVDNLRRIATSLAAHAVVYLGDIAATDEESRARHPSRAAAVAPDIGEPVRVVHIEPDRAKVAAAVMGISEEQARAGIEAGQIEVADDGKVAFFGEEMRRIVDEAAARSKEASRGEHQEAK